MRAITIFLGMFLGGFCGWALSVAGLGLFRTLVPAGPMPYGDWESPVIVLGGVLLGLAAGGSLAAFYSAERRRLPAAIRFVSVEPMLERMTLGVYLGRGGRRLGLDWVICGGETGPRARPMNALWARFLLSECRENRIPFFMKKMAGGDDPPAHLMVREWPK